MCVKVQRVMNMKVLYLSLMAEARYLSSWGRLARTLPTVARKPFKPYKTAFVSSKGRHCSMAWNARPPFASPVTTPTIYVDLCNPEWGVVHVDRDGWRVVPGHAAPVKFIRRPGMESLPTPVGGGSVDFSSPSPESGLFLPSTGPGDVPPASQPARNTSPATKAAPIVRIIILTSVKGTFYSILLQNQAWRPSRTATAS